MAVEETIRIGYRQYRGYDDPGLPDGHWFARGALQGDGTGASSILHVEFKPASTDPTTVSRLYSLEYILLNIVGVAAVVAMTMDNWDLPNFLPLTGQLVSSNVMATITPTTAQSGGRAGMDVASQARPASMFLGSPAKNTGRTDIAFQTDNINGTQVGVTMQGFYWEARAILAPGGPRKPADSLYGF